MMASLKAEEASQMQLVEREEIDEAVDKSLFEMAITTLLKMLSEGKFEGLHEQLEVKVKGTAAEGTIENLFVGHYQQTTNSKRDISAPKVRFLSLDLGVENCKDVYASFDKYVEGDNNDNVKKGGISFTDFPPILQLQLARFKYDERLRTMVKVNSRYEYPAQLDIDRDDGKYLADKADRNTRNLYTLGSVIVHRGGVQDGKYFAIVRPTLADVWVKLEDGVVQKVDANRALNEQYGGVIQHPPFKFEKGSNAFMLVYIRESEKESIMRSIVTKEVTELVRLETCEGKDDNAIHEDAAANRFVIIKVWRYEDVIDNDGIYIPGVDLTDPDCSFRVDKHVSFKEFEDKVAEYFGVDTHRLRFYEPQDLFRFIWPRSSDTTVETMVGASDEVTLFLKFDTRPSYTGHPDILEFVGSDDQAARVTKPASGKSSARVTKRATKSQKA